MRTLLACSWLVAALALFPACDDDRPANWSYVYQTVVAPNCITSACHTQINGQAGVQLHTEEAAYTVLVGKPCNSIAPPGEAPRNYVAPGQPESSRLIYLLRGAEQRLRMPPDRPLPKDDVDLVEQWILEGALCN